MAVAHVATTKANDNTAGTTATISVTPSSGELLLAGIVMFRAAGTHTVTATWNSIAMTQDKTASIGATNVTSVALFSLPVATGATSSITFTFSASVDFCTMFTMRVSGAATASYQDGTGGSGTGTSTAASTGAMSSTNSDDFWATVMGDSDATNPSTVTAGSGWSIDATNGRETNGAVNMVGGMEYIANPGATSETGTFTITMSDWAIVGQAYKAAAGGGGAPAGVGFLPVLGVGA